MPVQPCSLDVSLCLCLGLAGTQAEGQRRSEGGKGARGEALHGRQAVGEGSQRRRCCRRCVSSLLRRRSGQASLGGQSRQQQAAPRLLGRAPKKLLERCTHGVGGRQGRGRARLGAQKGGKRGAVSGEVQAQRPARPVSFGLPVAPSPTSSSPREKSTTTLPPLTTSVSSAHAPRLRAASEGAEAVSAPRAHCTAKRTAERSTASRVAPRARSQGSAGSSTRITLSTRSASASVSP